MKKVNVLFAIFLLHGFQLLNAQTTGFGKPKAAFLGLDIKGFNTTITSQANSITRLSLESIQAYELMDAYDVQYVAEKDSLKIDNCFGKICLVEIGKALGVDKMISGSIENLGDKLIISFRIIDVKNDLVEKSKILEFLNITQEIPLMVKLTLNSLFDITNDENVMSKLTLKSDYENTLNNPDVLMLKADGPRMGFTLFTGTHMNIIQGDLSEGGFNANPIMFQFGYQFEKQYLNEGAFQALFEFLPMITGLDQGFFIPSFTLLNGLRNNRTGWEFAFGPSINVVRKSYGYYDARDKWVRVRDDMSIPNKNDFPDAPDILEHRMDKRGTPFLASSFVIATGKTFRSGKLNIPVNFYTIPSKNGWRFGISMGYNSKKREMF